MNTDTNDTAAYARTSSPPRGKQSPCQARYEAVHDARRGHCSIRSDPCQERRRERELALYIGKRGASHFFLDAGNSCVYGGRSSSHWAGGGSCEEGVEGGRRHRRRDGCRGAVRERVSEPELRGM